MGWIRKNISGILLSFILAVAAAWLGNRYPLVGGPVFGILLGIIINNTVGKPAAASGGVAFVSKKILQWAIIVLGGSLSLGQVWETGLQCLSVMLSTLVAAFISAYGFGKLLGIPFRLTSLIGVGTAICGGSAIAAVPPVIEAEESEIAYSLSTIFFFNLLAALIFPPLGHLLGLSDAAFGLWTGTAVNDTSSVVAAGYAFSNPAGAYATIVKLTRTTMIIPISFIFALVMAGKKKKFSGGGTGIHYSFKSTFPWFIPGFLAASLLNTLGLFGKSGASHFASAGKFLIVMALTAVGLNSDLRKLLKTGVKPLFLGLILWLVVSSVSIAVQFITGQL